jgi:hypothetical protein
MCPQPDPNTKNPRRQTEAIGRRGSRLGVVAGATRPIGIIIAQSKALSPPKSPPSPLNAPPLPPAPSMLPGAISRAR